MLGGCFPSVGLAVGGEGSRGAGAAAVGPPVLSAAAKPRAACASVSPHFSDGVRGGLCSAGIRTGLDFTGRGRKVHAVVNLYQDLPHWDDDPSLAAEPVHASRLGRRDFHQGLVGLDFRDGLILQK